MLMIGIQVMTGDHDQPEEAEEPRRPSNTSSEPLEEEPANGEHPGVLGVLMQERERLLTERSADDAAGRRRSSDEGGRRSSEEGSPEQGGGGSARRPPKKSSSMSHFAYVSPPLPHPAFSQVMDLGGCCSALPPPPTSRNLKSGIDIYIYFPCVYS